MLILPTNPRNFNADYFRAFARQIADHQLPTPNNLTIVENDLGRGFERFEQGSLSIHSLWLDTVVTFDFVRRTALVARRRDDAVRKNKFEAPG